jgi:protein-S-isoprenylcysteine O-methyltransferase Ste14
VHLWCLGTASFVGTVRGATSLTLYASALAVFFAAKRSLQGYRLTLAFSADAPRVLIDRGLYARVRHPFYLAYSLTWIAGAAAVPSPLTIGSTAIMMAFYVSAAKREESKFSATRLGSAYDAYKRRAGLLWPRIRHRDSQM